MKKLLVIGLGLIVIVLLSGVLIANALSGHGDTYTFGGIGPSTSGYVPNANVKVVQIHAEAQVAMTFKVNGVSYPCVWKPNLNAYHCDTPFLVPVPYGPYPYVEIQTLTGSYWWVDVNEYTTGRYIHLLPELIRDGTSAPRTPGVTNTPIPTDQLPFSVGTPQPVDHPYNGGSSVVVMTAVPEVQP